MVENRYQYNGKELEKDLGINLYDYGARWYDAAVGRFTTTDPRATDYAFQSPYAYAVDNPVGLRDILGMGVTDEYDKDGKRLSGLGGNKINFYHLGNGDTKVVDLETGASTIIKGGEKLIRGYSHRKKSISWAQLYDEFEMGYGPEKSLISDFDDSKVGIFSSLRSWNSTYSSTARVAVLTSGKPKDLIEFRYTDTNPYSAGIDMWEQFLGRVNLSYYKLGNKVLYLMRDSKSATSLSYRVLPSWDRSTSKPYGTTYQTYIWTETKDKVYTNDRILRRVNQGRERMLLHTQ